MIKHTTYFIFIALLGLFSCENEIDSVQTEKEEKIQEIDSIDSPDSLPSIDSVVFLNNFSIENLKTYTDSMNAYFKTFNRGTDSVLYNIKIDTIVDSNLTTYKYHAYIPFEVYEYQTSEEATDKFNEMYTIELVRRFGLNKRPNHIVVDSNRVIWLKLEHPIGHRLKDIKKVFNSAFNFHPKSSNADSISGFNYCNCWSLKDTTIYHLTGKWHANSYTLIDSFAKPYSNYSSSFLADNYDSLELTISKDTIEINGNAYKYRVVSSKTLPSANYYWKYLFSEAYFRQDDNTLTFNFLSILRQLRANPNKVREYNIQFSYDRFRKYANFITMDDKTIYLIRGNRFFILRK